MRFVAVDRLKEGDIIAQDILDRRGNILLREKSTFKEAYRKKFIELGVIEIRVEDELSKGIQPRTLLNPHIREGLSRDIKNEFIKLQNSLEIDTKAISAIANTLIEELMPEEVICEITDLRVNHLGTYEHCLAVAIMTAITCKKMQIDLIATHKIVMGAVIHDIGKIIISRDILDKEGPLTDAEYNIMQTHPTIGYNMIKDNMEITPITKVVVLCHHEREDGSGYPLGKNSDLHIGAKIVAVCDVFHALLSDRVYRKGLPINEAIRIAAKEKLNPEIRGCVENILAFYPIGSIVKLNTGDIAIVEKNFSTDLRRPEVRVVDLQKRTCEIKISLLKEEKIYIAERLSAIPYID